MKNILWAFAATLLIACNSKSENSANEEFVHLSEDKEFVESHDEPKEIEADLLGEMIEVPVEGAEVANAYFIQSKETSNKYLFLIHEWWGLNDFVKLHGDGLYKELGNVNVIALDLYDGKVAVTREKATEYMQGADESRINSIIAATLKMAGDDAEIATIGWCFGGGWSLKTALVAGTNAKACVMYYGMPVNDLEELAQLEAPVLFIYGKQDQWISEEVATTFNKNMDLIEKQIRVESYDADHAFANPSSEHYLEQAAQDANLKTLNFLKAYRF